MQQIQVLPVQSAQGGQHIIMQPNHTAAGQAQTAQVIQTADGQTLIYQPVQVRKYFSSLCKDCHRNNNTSAFNECHFAL